MKLLRLLTLLLSAAVCSAAIRGEVEDSVDDFGEEYEMDEEQDNRELKKGGRGGANNYFYGKGGMGGKGGGGKKGGYTPAASPVYTPSTSAGGCGTPTCGTPTCGTPGCGNVVTAPVFYSGSGKGGGKSGKKGGYGFGKGGNGKSGKKGGGLLGKGVGKGGGFNPAPSPAGSPAGPPAGPGTCGCDYDEVTLEFVMLSPNATVPVSVGVPDTTIGSVFIYNDALFDLNLTALPGTFVAGLCTRTQLTQNVGEDNTLVGGGYCHFTFTVSDGVTSVSFNAAGEVFDVLGGTLSVAGGTGELVGVYGEVELVPVYQETNQIDFFTEASVYVGTASLFVPLF